VHVLFQQQFVLVNVASELCDFVVFAQPNLFRHLIDETKVVRHQHQTAVVAFDGVGQCVNATNLHVKEREDEEA